MIEFRTLGTIDLRGSDGAAVQSVLSQPKRLALLAYLALERPGEPHRRDSLTALLWPELDQERARAQLRKALHYLRRSLGVGVLTGSGAEVVGIETGRLRCDALEFEAALESGEVERALELYGGELLDGLFVSGSVEFERWLDHRRSGLRDRATGAAWTMADRDLEGGNPVGAAHWGRRALAIDSHSETGLRRLLTLLDRTGDRAGAILAYEEFARRLETEGVRPAPETAELVRLIRARDEPRPLQIAESRDPRREAPDDAERRRFEGSVSAGIPDGPKTRDVASPRQRAWRRARAAAAFLLPLTVGIGAIQALSGGADPSESSESGRDLEVLLADFASPDPDLARAMSEAFRVDVARSRTLRLVEPLRVMEALERMGRAPDGTLDPATARELGRREGVPLVITGGAYPVGTGYVLSAEVLQSTDGAVLASHRAMAADADGVLQAMEELAGVLRRRVGELDPGLGGKPSMEQVTTSDLRALESFSLALEVLLREGEFARGIALLEHAIEQDSLFASAHATLGVVLASRDRTRAVESLSTAYRYRDLVTERERLWIDAWYSRLVEGSPVRAAHAYASLIELETPRAPTTDLLALHAEYADVLISLRADARAEEHARRALELDRWDHWTIPHVLTRALAYQGKPDAAESALMPYLEHARDQPRMLLLLGHLKASRAEYETARTTFERARQLARSDGFNRVEASYSLASLAAIPGRLEAAAGALEETPTDGVGFDLPGGSLRRAVWLAMLEMEVAARPQRALAGVDAVLRREPLSRIPLLDRPYLLLAELFALAGATGRARAILEEFEALPEVARGRPDRHGGRLVIGSLHRARGALALAEGRYADAVRDYRRADRGRCRICALPGLARAYDLGGRSDSAITVYERYLETPEAERLASDPFYLGPTYERLGQLYETRGDTARAGRYHRRFVEIWSAADPGLQPRVAAAWKRVAALEGR